MKHVFSSHSEVCHIWAQQTQNDGRAASIFFEGQTIYSYGRHFPIATIEGNDVFFTLRGYSNSTAKHKNYAHRAITHKNIIDCFEVPVKYEDKPLKKHLLLSVHSKNEIEWKNQIVSLFQELGNKRNRDITGRMNSLKRNIDQLTVYCDYFNYKVKDKELKKLLKQFNSPDFLAVAKLAVDKENEAKERKLIEAKKAFDTYIDLWQNFDTSGLYNLPGKVKDLANFYKYQQRDQLDLLRFNRQSERIETSKNVQIPYEIGKRFWQSLKANEVKPGSKILDYTVGSINGTVKIGCHTFKTDYLIKFGEKIFS